MQLTGVVKKRQKELETKELETLKAQLITEEQDVVYATQQLVQIEKHILQAKEDLHQTRVKNEKAQETWLTNYGKGNVGFLNFTKFTHGTSRS
jgi:ribosomal protein S15P/S13E